MISVNMLPVKFIKLPNIASVCLTLVLENCFATENEKEERQKEHRAAKRFKRRANYDWWVLIPTFPPKGRKMAI